MLCLSVTRRPLTYLSTGTLLLSQEETRLGLSVAIPPIFPKPKSMLSEAKVREKLRERTQVSLVSSPHSSSTHTLRFLSVLEGWISSSFELGITQCLVGRGARLFTEGPGPCGSCAPTHLRVSSWGTGELWEPLLPGLGIHLDGTCGSLAAGTFSTLYLPSKWHDNMVHVV